MSKDLAPWKPPALIERARSRLPELKFRPRPAPLIRRAGRAITEILKAEFRAQVRDMADVVEDHQEDRRQERIDRRLDRRYRRSGRGSSGLLPGDPGTPGAHYIGELWVLRRGGFASECGKWIIALAVIAALLGIAGMFDRSEPEPAPIVQPLRTEAI